MIKTWPSEPSKAQSRRQPGKTIIDMDPNSVLLHDVGAMSCELFRLLDLERRGLTLDQTSIGDRLGVLLGMLPSGDTPERRLLRALIYSFVMDLRLIESVNPQILRSLANNACDRDQGNFFGVRFETRVAASLLKKGFRLRPSGADGTTADFSVETESGGPLRIECRSLTFARRRSRQGNEIRRKILDAIAEKAAKPYFGPDLMLFIDVTGALCDYVGSGMTEFLGGSWEELIVDVCTRDGGALFLEYTYVDPIPNALGIGTAVWAMPCSYAKPEVKRFFEAYRERMDTGRVPRGRVPNIT